MTEQRILPAGTYELIAIERNDEGDFEVATDPNALHNLDDDRTVILLDMDGDAGRAPVTELDGLASHLILNVDIGDVEPDGSSTMTPYGPITISSAYLLKPTDAITANHEPHVQYAANWLSFRLDEPAALSVEGGTITIGTMAITPGALGDVTFTPPGTGQAPVVSRIGDPVHAILSELRRVLDDGVLILAEYDASHVAGVTAVGTPQAEAFAREMKAHAVAGGGTLVLRMAPARA